MAQICGGQGQGERQTKSVEDKAPSYDVAGGFCFFLNSTGSVLFAACNVLYLCNL